VVKRYVVPKGAADADSSSLDRSYHIGFTIEIFNQGEKAISTAYRLEGPTGLPIEGWWYTTKTHPKLFYSAGARDVVFDISSTGHKLVGCSEIVGKGQAAKEDLSGETLDRTSIITSSAAPDDREAAYFGVDSLYFASVLIPRGLGTEVETKAQPRFPIASAAARTVSDLTKIPAKSWNRKGNVTFELTSDLKTIEPGKAWKSEYEIFVGPKTPEVLSQYGLSRVLELGWFAMIARVLSAFLHFIHSIVPSYAIAILLLTVTVRCCVLPFSLKAAKGAAVMQALAPEMQKIKEKHKDDPAKQGEAMKELWRKNNYNPLSGCLPVFLQIPIFVALYKTLSTDIELRGTPLISGVDWARNLAGPDMLFYWEPYLWPALGSEVGYLGPFFNVFPLVTVALFLWQQILFTPPATNDEMKMQQQIMKFMTIFMGVMFFKVPAGLCIYFITSSLWGICERLLLFPKPVTVPAAASTSDSENKKKVVESRVKATVRK
jgi:YidC/Oxa1 family membrane protein insertase